jgi:heme oxygenase (biliverdin-IX-beta and delta-forming)
MLAAALPDDVTVVGREASGLRAKLRQSTAAAHRRLDAGFSAFDLTSLQGYRRFLEASAAALLPLETALDEGGIDALFPDWPQRSRRAAIISDLDRLDTTARPLCRVAPLERDGLLGVMYVLEGSRLGAKFLLRTIAERGDARIKAATDYLRHGADKPLWQDFVHRLEGEPVTAADEAAIIRGARGAFAMFAEAAARA